MFISTQVQVTNKVELKAGKKPTLKVISQLYLWKHLWKATMHTCKYFRKVIEGVILEGKKLLEEQ